MQNLLESLSPIERRVYWRWCLIILAFYALLVIAGGVAVIVHRSAVASIAQPVAMHITSGRAFTPKNLPQQDFSDVARLIGP